MINYYKDNENNILFYSDIQTPKEGLMPLTPEELDAHLNPPPALEPVPEVVSKAQGKAALVQAGLWQAVLDYVDNTEDSTEKTLAEIALNDTQEWRRSSPLLNSMATALGLSSEVLDGLFVTAASIEF